jgi:hypothetical protein
MILSLPGTNFKRAWATCTEPFDENDRILKQKRGSPTQEQKPKEKTKTFSRPAKISAL